MQVAPFQGKQPAQNPILSAQNPGFFVYFYNRRERRRLLHFCGKTAALVCRNSQLCFYKIRTTKEKQTEAIRGNIQYRPAPPAEGEYHEDNADYC